MKKGLIIFIFLWVSSAFAQNVNDFKYVIIPEQFSDFEQNQYRLNYILLRLLEEKQYEVLKSDSLNWPQEVIQNPCLALNSDILRKKHFLKMKVELVFTDCSGKEIGKFEGISSEKEYSKGYPDALRKASQTIRVSNPKELNYEIPLTENTVVSEKPEIQIQRNHLENAWFEAGIEFTNENKNLILTEMKDGSYLLIQKENKEIIGQFYPSAKPEIFHVKIIEDSITYNTIGYYDGENLSIEIPNEKNTWKLIEYKKVK